jgi:predicted house-cleaning noncanonical NTP pyrophosphatase (MazG superfamily)
MKTFIIGIAAGTVLGAAIVANSQKSRKLFIKSQDELKNKMEELIDEKLKKFEEDDDLEYSEKKAKLRR